MTRWEYKVVQPERFERGEDLNRLGADGWELVSINYSKAIYTLKRPLPESTCIAPAPVPPAPEKTYGQKKAAMVVGDAWINDPSNANRGVRLDELAGDVIRIKFAREFIASAIDLARADAVRKEREEICDWIKREAKIRPCDQGLLFGMALVAQQIESRKDITP